jgi:hypothetical protein
MTATVKSQLHVAGLSLDCADPGELSTFYRQLLGGEILWANADSVGVRTSSVVLVAQRVVSHVPPIWPGTSIVHLDLAAVPDLDSAVANAVRLGATLASLQQDSRWRVLLDPAGHPFCITTVTAE